LIAIRKPAAAELQTELLRKSIHFFIAMVPPLATMNLSVTMALLGSGILVYTAAEVLRLQGRVVPLISSITRMASRDRDRGRFVLGPVTLGLGAMLALMLYPEPAAFLAIYALAFGDGLASLVGKFYPMGRIIFLGDKTLSGSFACFAGVFFASYGVTGNLEVSFFLALIGTLLEAVPAGDLDNIIIPMGTGLAAALMLS
jgi:dolichol kinase